MNGKQQNMHQVVTSVWIQNHGWQNQNAGERLVIDSRMLGWPTSKD
jgi:hypothetical protein